ncbi:heme biosynthesis protein HemY [Candidatus Methylospira mobilis]|uniref:Heme biosynthesis protein HemY n=1 Tax=Candidatus Methylospira mobilis TaxID=1808979 RepID=A0A5Q0BLH9_9GAMM|nr:heme biosynthesis HemY N-terminal domain-containing protein [Candidatus Methylospira mobilis]QFY44693.1 heme biosynthesis protein HemY [Candidatus Methylospira mobilis]WNV05768.1 heme biosynthesis HemY N-terminal domain-containing protein [Candidatus Methylospira mobilis]
MKTLIYLFIWLVAIIGTVILLHFQAAAYGPGQVTVSLGHWEIEATLFFVGAVLLIGFIFLYIAIRLSIGIFHLPRFLKRRSQEQRALISQQALVAGLIESAEGNWETAEQYLIRHAANSGTPLIHYLTAARAAQSRGAHSERDSYLSKAHELMPEAELAIGLTKAELQLSNQQFDEALASLTHLNKIAPSHAKVLKMMHQAYAQMEDWDGVTKLLPQMHKNKVLMEAEIKLLETETFSALLKRKSEAHSAETMRNTWLDVPEHIRAVPGIQQIYIAAMIEAGSGAEVEPMLRKALDKEWSETLLVLYGHINLPDPQKQQQQVLAWLSKKGESAVLLRVLGKLALRTGDNVAARNYLEKSLGLEPSVEVYQLTGDLLLKLGNALLACQYFRNGLLFASGGVVEQIIEPLEDPVTVAMAEETPES